MRFLILTLASACTPHLVSEQEAVTGMTWEAPDNSWDTNVPPSNLRGEGFALGDVPKDFRLVDQHGAEVSLWQFYGSVILLDISTMWCAPCQRIAHHVNDTWEDYRDQGFMYITVLPEDIDGDTVEADDLDEWAGSFGIEAPVLADNEGFGYEVEPQKVWPVLMLIDRKMKVVAERIPATDEAVRNAIESEL